MMLTIDDPELSSVIAWRSFSSLCALSTACVMLFSIIGKEDSLLLDLRYLKKVSKLKMNLDLRVKAAKLPSYP